MENYTNSEMTHMVYNFVTEVQMMLAQALYREKFPARRVPHSQTFLAVEFCE
jgi:hypothetical protein